RRGGDLGRRARRPGSGAGADRTGDPRPGLRLPDAGAGDRRGAAARRHPGGRERAAGPHRVRRGGEWPVSAWGASLRRVLTFTWAWLRFTDYYVLQFLQANLEVFWEIVRPRPAMEPGL